MAENNPARKVVTPPFRMSFPSLLEPREDEETKRKTYQLSMLFPPKTDMTKFKLALRAAMSDKFGADDTKWPRCKRGTKEVIRDFGEYNASTKKPLKGDWSGWIMVRANCSDKYAPGVVGSIKGADGKFPRVTDPREVYSGRWACAVIDAYHFDGKKNDGVTFGLKNVQLLKHDTSFVGAQSAPEEDFEDASEEWSGQGDAFEKGEPAAATGGDWG